MENYLNTPVDRWGSDSAKWDFMHMMNPDAKMGCIPMWIADMDFPCSDAIVNAMHERVDRQIFGYSAFMSGEFLRSVCGWFEHRFNWYVKSSDIVYSPGIVTALAALINVLTQPGDGVLIQQPVYYPFMRMTGNNNREIINNPLVNDGNGYYTIDFEHFEKCAAMERTKIFILCHPHNPVGRVWKVEELRKMADICAKHGVVIVSDEIHFDLVRKGIKHTPIELACPEHKQNIITCTAPSKSFNLAGLHASFIVMPNKNHRDLWNGFVVKQLGINLISPMGIVATKAAYYDSEPWLDNLNEYIDANLQFMADFLKKHAPKVKFRIPEATFLTWLDIREYGLDSMAFYKELVSAGKLLAESGTMFGAQEGQGFIRINAACARDVLQQALARFVYTLNRLRVGAKARNFSYLNAKGESKHFFSETAKNKKTMLLFLRYEGCTMCRLDIAQLIEQAEAYKNIGMDIAVVLQSSKENTAHLAQAPIEIIADPEKALYDLYSIMPAITTGDLMDKGALERIICANRSGFEHGEYEGNENQLPAVFVVDNNQNVLYANYLPTIDIEPALNEVCELFFTEIGETDVD